MNNRVRDALNDQIGREFYAAYLYLSMSNYFERESLPGFAHFMHLQAREEVSHAKKIMDHLQDRDGRVELQAIDEPPADFGSPLEVMRGALEHEQKVTGHINDIYDLAVEEGDRPAQLLMQWFVDEQVEEEKWAGEIVAQLERVGESGASVMVLDAKLGERGGE